MPLFNVSKKTMPPKLLRDRYLVPPFSLLDAQSGYWAQRKQEWEMILKDRENNIRNTTARGNTPYINQFDTDDFKGMKSPGAGDISTFDPFLTEILIKWFSLENMTILDPFAGGIVRGAVAGILGRNYYGVDISLDQVLFNQKRWFDIIKEYPDIKSKSVHWINDDAELHEFGFDFDMMLTCPPYYNLERYTDNPEDLSNKKSYDDFIHKYIKIIQNCYNMLKDNSFAIIVVEEIRDKNGIMYGFVPDTIKAFMQVGFKYYNEMILENRVVSLGIRCPKYFEQSRKVGRHHQNVLVFYKGDEKQIADKFGGFVNG